MLGYFGTTLVFILIVITTIIYNILQKARNNVKISCANMELSMKKRWQEIPELMEMLKKHSIYDNSILEKMSDLSSNNYEKLSVDKKLDIDEKVSKVFLKILDIFEEYPEIRDSEEYIALKKYLIDIENDIESSKKKYRIMSEKYNSKIRVFPNNLIAILFGFDEEGV